MGRVLAVESDATGGALVHVRRARVLTLVTVTVVTKAGKRVTVPTTST